MAFAQQPATARALPLGTIDGTVTDTNLVALADATISILGASAQVVTRSNGRFRLVNVPPGLYRLLVRRIGFEPVLAPVQVTGGDTSRLSVNLSPATTTLETVKVKGQRLTPAMQEFEARRKLGLGHFITQADIEKRNVEGVSDLLAAVPSVRMSGRWPTAQRMYPLKSCPFQVYLDGVKMPVDSARGIDNVAIPREIAGIEVYSGAATIPLQYKSTSHAFCGVILMWTRIGS